MALHTSPAPSCPDPCADNRHGQVRHGRALSCSTHFRTHWPCFLSCTMRALKSESNIPTGVKRGRPPAPQFYFPPPEGHESPRRGRAGRLRFPGRWRSPPLPVKGAGWCQQGTGCVTQLCAWAPEPAGRARGRRPSTVTAPAYSGSGACRSRPPVQLPPQQEKWGMRHHL